MVHLRLNDPDTSRNRHINYITVLPQYADHEEARQRLLQLAAQVKPVMKAHGFQINSLEEYEWNREFAGRNWNNGETVELILRRQNGSFAPLQWVLMVFCHELAHIKYMNHIPSQHGKLDSELRAECRQLQSRGYFGDGFWSAGKRLENNAFVAGMGMDSLQGLPEYSCGGAYSSKKKGVTRRKRTAGGPQRKRGFKGPSLHTGAQTAPNTKSGGRRLQSGMPGQGSRVDTLNFIPKASAQSTSYRNDPNSTFRKRTQTASARELRAQAALRRFATPETLPKKEAKQENLDTFLRSTKEEDSGESFSSGSETEEETADGNGGMTVDEVRIKTEPEPSTQASEETADERRERARLYRQHERSQGGSVRTTAQDWTDFCVLPTANTDNSYIEILSSDDDEPPDNAAKWECSKCTLLNPAHASTCSVCLATRR